MVQNDKKAILGYWKLVGSYLGRRRIKGADQGTLFHFTPKRYRHIRTDVDYEYELFPARKPQEINLYYGYGRRREFIVRGIYELEGDTLRLRFSNPFRARPKSFTRSADSSHPTDLYERHARKTAYKRKTPTSILIPGTLMPKAFVKRSGCRKLQELHKQK